MNGAVVTAAGVLPREAELPARPGRAIALAAAVQGVGGGLAWSLLPPLFGEIGKELQLSETMTGVVWGAAPLGIALAAPFGGAMVDRRGARTVVTVALLVGALACAARAFVADGVSLAVAMLAFGMHVGFVAPALPKALASHVPLTALGRANGIALLAYTLGTAATVFTARAYIAPAVGGWRNAMLLAAGAVALVAVIFFLLYRDRARPSAHASFRQVLGMAKDFQLLRVAGVQLLLFGGYLALLGQLPRALLASGVAPLNVGAVVALWLVSAAVANFAGPAISDRIGRRLPVLRIGAAVAGLSLLCFALLPGDAGPVLLVLAALGGGAFAPLLLVVPVELPSVGPARAGAALGLLMLVGQAGGFVLSVSSGALAERFGQTSALILLAVAHLAILVVAFGLRETGAASRRAS